MKKGTSKAVEAGRRRPHSTPSARRGAKVDAVTPARRRRDEIAAAESTLADQFVRAHAEAIDRQAINGTASSEQPALKTWLIKADGGDQWVGNPELRTLLKPMASLKHDPENVRLHPERNLAAITASLTANGQQKPVVATADGTIIAGNGLFAAASAMGWGTLAVVTFNGTKNEARAYALADNRTAELAKWDHEGLSKLLLEMKSEDVNLDGLGWDAKELDMLLQASWAPPDKEPGGLGGEAVKRQITMTHEQFEIVTAAIQRVRERENDAEISDGRALELICADFLGRP